MPKETVSNASKYDPDFKVEVRWSRQQYVQIATVDACQEGTEEYGFFVDLDRERINKLIRDLRRARDQAFGRDE